MLARYPDDAMTTIDPTDHYEAWRECLMDELYSDPEALSEAVDQWIDGGTQQALTDLVAALSGIENGATALDNCILQHSAAKKVIENLVNQIVAEQRKVGRDYDWRRG
jgi:hypothetical protein